MGLNGKVCIVTGGGSGIGRSASLMMAEAGAKVVLVGRTVSKVEDVRDEITAAGGTAMALGLDVGDYDGVIQMAKDVLDAYGQVDVLVNNAGHSSHHRRLMTTTPDELRGVLDSNVAGSVYCSQAVVPHMRERGEGTIINVSSMAGVNASLLAGMAYSAAKAAVINFTAFLNTELKNTGIRSSVVIPGEVDTPILDNRPIVPDGEARDTMVTAEDAAEAIFLIANLPQRACIPELIIRPTYMRDTSAEAGAA
ncbi:MAG: SDR family oxidoreductase [Chloroflexi bacterium]|nr:SDR family oxidoreductase [Chloroflexota bacterium]